MKLLYCKKCNSVINLDTVEKKCSCGECGGKYEKNEMDATFFGDAIPFAIDNFSFFERALREGDSLGNKLYDTWHGHQKVQCWILKGSNPNVSTITKVEEPKLLEPKTAHKLSRCGA